MQESVKKLQCLSGSSLKVIAIITMLIDHIGAVIYYYDLSPSGVVIYPILRNIGRIAFPIFCFLLVEGFMHTHDVKKYAIRLGLFALISEIPFDLALTRPDQSIWMKQNVFWTLLIALFVLIGFRLIEAKIPVTYTTWQGILYVSCAAAGGGLAYLMKTDYSYKGVLAICILYLFRSVRIGQAVAGAICFVWEKWALWAFIPILLYNGKRGFRMKYFFYLFYPIHLFILYGIAHFGMHLF